MLTLTLSKMCLITFLTFLLQDAPSFDRSRIAIVDTGKPIPFDVTNIEAGPVVGNMLNAHFFPGINYYNAGRYNDAERELTYVINRPQYLQANPRQAEFMAAAYYLRGMIFVYHATGVGQFALAKRDLEGALKWNPDNDLAYLEMSRVYLTLGFYDQSVSMLEALLGRNSDPGLSEEIRKDLERIKKDRQNLPNSVPAASQTGTFRLPGGEPKAATPEVIIDINAKPWAEVFLAESNLSLGQTPLSGVHVPAGASLIFRNPSFPEKRYKISDKDRSVVVTLP